MSGLFIFVLDRGFVVVGRAELSKDLALHWHLPVSRTVRQWGTDKGLAQLQDGPIAGKTILDPVCERTVPFRAVLDIIHVPAEGVGPWTKALCE